MINNKLISIFVGAVAVVFSHSNQAETITIGDLELSTGAYVNGLYGFSSADDIGEFSFGGHDPNRIEELQLQELEIGLEAKYKFIDLFANYNIFTDAEGDFDNEFEEYYATVKLGLVELRGGQYLHRIGFHNYTHLHAWNYVDAPIANSLFLGEEGLRSRGIELNWDTKRAGVFSFSFGKALSHDHGQDEEHEHEEEEHHNEEEEHHDEEEEEDEHGHEDEELAFDDELFSIAYRGNYNLSDYHRLQGTLGYVQGETEEGEDLSVYQVGAQYGWYQNGYDSGNWVKLTGEFFWRDSEEGNDFGMYADVSARLTEEIVSSVRYSMIDGEEDHDRISAALTYVPSQAQWVSFRSQYNYDRLDDGTNEHSVWFQVGLSFGLTR